MKVDNNPRSSDIAPLLPFYQQNADELHNELWVGGGRKWSIRVDKRWPRGRERGNYVRSYVFSNLRIEAKATRPRVKWNLEAMWDYLPVDLVISIFGFLHPIDLYHAIRATKGLRRFLLDRSSTSIWKECFLNHPDIPFYPDDVSPPKWVSLIFGPATCDICGQGNSLVEYSLRSRKCDECSDYYNSHSNAVTNAISPIIGKFPISQVHDIWELAVKIRRLKAFRYPDEAYYNNPPRYSMSQIVEVAHKMRKYLVDVREGVPGAEENYKAFVNTTKAAVLARDKHTRLCNLWAYDIYGRYHAVFMASLHGFYALSRKTLLERGYDPRDISEAETNFRGRMSLGWSAVSDYRLSESKLWKYLPTLESLVIEARTMRRYKELARRSYTRRANIASCYQHHVTKSAFTYQEILRGPHLETIFKDKFFADYINDPEDVELDRTLAEQNILSFVDAYVNGKKRRLLRFVLEAGVLPKAVTVDSDPDDYLGLAIAVFECGPRTFVGWEEVAAHECRSHSELWHMPDTRDSSFPIRFSNIGYQALKNLAQLLHLDSSFGSLLSKDLDILNKRFICKTCQLTVHAGVHLLPALTWHECLDHAVKSQYPLFRDLHDAVFDVLSEPLTDNIVALEEAFPPPSYRVWSCRHCTTYIEPLTRSEAVTHAYKVHGIFKAAAPADFSFIRDERSFNYPLRFPLLIGLDKNASYRCLRCPRSNKLWRKKDPDLHQHLLDLHGIKPDDLVEGVDWMKYKIVENDGWIQKKIRIQDSEST